MTPLPGPPPLAGVPSSQSIPSFPVFFLSIFSLASLIFVLKKYVQQCVQFITEREIIKGKNSIEKHQLHQGEITFGSPCRPQADDTE